jgi:hypothetical protein
MRATPEEKLLRAIFGTKHSELSVRFSIKPSSAWLCDRCKHVSRVQMESCAEAIRFCDALPIDVGSLGIPSRVTECTSFQSVTEMSLGDMKEKAWYLAAGKGEKIGFIRPGSKEHKEIRESRDVRNLQ